MPEPEFDGKVSSTFWLDWYLCWSETKESIPLETHKVSLLRHVGICGCENKRRPGNNWYLPQSWSWVRDSSPGSWDGLDPVDLCYGWGRCTPRGSWRTRLESLDSWCTRRQGSNRLQCPSTLQIFLQEHNKENTTFSNNQILALGSYGFDGWTLWSEKCAALFCSCFFFKQEVFSPSNPTFWLSSISWRWFQISVESLGFEFATTHMTFCLVRKITTATPPEVILQDTEPMESRICEFQNRKLLFFSLCFLMRAFCSQCAGLKSLAPQSMYNG